MINLWYDFVFSNKFVCNLIGSDLRSKFFNNEEDTINKSLRCEAILPDYLFKNCKNLNFRTMVSASFPKSLQDYSQDKNFYPIEPRWFNGKNWQLNLKDKENFFLKFIQRINGEILVWYPTEGFYYDKWPFFDDVISFLPKTKIRFVFGNLKNPQWLQHKPNVIYKPYDYWWKSTKGYLPCKELDINKQESYEFTLYNRRYKLTRAVPYYLLEQRNKLKNALHTFHGVFDAIDPSNIIIDELIPGLLKQSEMYYKENSSDELKQIVESKDFLEWSRKKVNNINKTNIMQELFVGDHKAEIWSTSLHDQSYLDIITETDALARKNHLLVTEKTYRSIAAGSIFLISGSGGTLAYLKSKGIETFSDIFDESYDDEGHIHWFNRWKIIEKNLDIWRELGPAGRKNYYQKSFEKLKHNQHVFYTRDFTDETFNLFYD